MLLWHFGDRVTIASDTEISPLVLALLVALYDERRDRTGPLYVSVRSLPLDATRDELNDAVNTAKESGWIIMGGGLRQRIAITAAGLSLLRQAGMA